MLLAVLCRIVSLCYMAVRSWPPAPQVQLSEHIWQLSVNPLDVWVNEHEDFMFHAVDFTYARLHSSHSHHQPKSKRQSKDEE